MYEQLWTNEKQSIKEGRRVLVDIGTRRASGSQRRLSFCLKIFPTATLTIRFCKECSIDCYSGRTYPPGSILCRSVCSHVFQAEDRGRVALRSNIRALLVTDDTVSRCTILITEPPRRQDQCIITFVRMVVRIIAVTNAKEKPEGASAGFRSPTY